MTYKVYLAATTSPPRCKARRPGHASHSFIYWTDDGNVAALRYDDWKIGFQRQDAKGFGVWQEPFVALRTPSITNLRMDPFERAQEENAMGYTRWIVERMFAFAAAGAYVAEWLQSFKEFPPRRSPAASISTA